MQHLGRQPWTLLHQDFRVENLFFDPSGGEVVVIDWQSLGRGPGAYDLAYLLGGSMRPSSGGRTSAPWSRSTTSAWWPPASRATPTTTCGATTRISHLVNTAVPVLVGATMDLANERGTELIATLGRRHFSAVVDLDAVDLIPR